MVMVVCGSCESAAWYSSMLPDAVGGWRASGAVKLVNKSNIFDYMDGAGELYLAYDFKDLAVREYAKPSQPKITAEVYRLGSSSDAYGVYSHERGGGGPAGIGQDRDYGVGLLRFWKNTYFVRIVAEKETEQSKAAVLATGRLISRSISGTGKRPSMLGMLPKTGLIPDSVHYFHKHTVLNFHFYLADGNILNLSAKTEALLAQYKIDSSKPRLLIVRYPSVKDATSAYDHFARTYFKDKPVSKAPSRVEAVEHGEFTGARRSRNVLRFVFEAKTREQCAKLLQH
jgi:hypothetical protein